MVGLAVYFCATPGVADEPHQYEFLMVEPPASPFSDRWTLIVDTSSSGQRVFGKTLFAYEEIMRYTTDEFYFSMFSFNNLTYFREWEQVSPEAIRRNKAWLDDTKGVLSRCTEALTLVFRDPEPHLTIILVGDGGFTEACFNRGFDQVEKIIRDGQDWRIANGLYPAIICSVGIENVGYTAGGKPTDRDCQDFLRHIGALYHGGYFLVR